MQAIAGDQMSVPSHVVVGLEYERSISGSHEHVAGVWTNRNNYVPRDDVLRSIARGEVWWSVEDGRRFALRRVTHCPWPGCSVIPYLHVGGTDVPGPERSRG